MSAVADETATHRLRIHFEESTETLWIYHYCSVEVDGMNITRSEPVTLTDAGAFAAALSRLIDTNRVEMEHLAYQAAVEHVAAVQGVHRKGRKQVKIGGTMGATGKAGG